MKRFKANRASLRSVFHRASPEIAWIRLSRITNEYRLKPKCLLKFKRGVALAVALNILQFCFTNNNMSFVTRKPNFAYAKTKTQIDCAFFLF